jgi:hypothetical protein
MIYVAIHLGGKKVQKLQGKYVRGLLIFFGMLLLGNGGTLNAKYSNLLMGEKIVNMSMNSSKQRNTRIGYKVIYLDELIISVLAGLVRSKLWSF